MAKTKETRRSCTCERHSFLICGLWIIDQSQYNIISTLLELLEQLCYNPKSGAECSVNKKKLYLRKTQLSDLIGVICPTIPPGKRDTGQVPFILLFQSLWSLDYRSISI
jgi:hypothetical protein